MTGEIISFFPSIYLHDFRGEIFDFLIYVVACQISVLTWGRKLRGWNWRYFFLYVVCTIGQICNTMFPSIRGCHITPFICTYMFGDCIKIWWGLPLGMKKKTMVIFVTMKEAREGMTGEVLLGRKEIINQTGTMEFYCFSPIHFYQCLGFYPPRVIVCWSGSQIPSCGRLLMAAYLFCICATHRSFCMINCLHLSTRRRRPCHLVVVGWEA